jgi:hypothetical protein
MSVIKVNNITNLDGTSGPVIAGITTVSSTSHFVVPTGSTGQKVALAPDPYINNLVLALPFNSESVFSDASPRGNQPMPTGIGATTASLPFGVSGVTTTSSGIVTFSKYYGTSCYYTGVSGQYLTTPPSSDFSVGRENFTVEFWVNPATVNSFHQIFDTRGGTSASTTGFSIGYTSLVFYIYVDAFLVQTSTAPSLGSWTHIAVTRINDVFYFYINGTLSGTSTTTNTYNFTNSIAYIGATGSSDTAQFLKGYLQDLRIYKGVAKYTSNFTPPNQIAL